MLYGLLGIFVLLLAFVSIDWNKAFNLVFLKKLVASIVGVLTVCIALTALFAGRLLWFLCVMVVMIAVIWFVRAFISSDDFTPQEALAIFELHSDCTVQDVENAYYRTLQSEVTMKNLGLTKYSLFRAKQTLLNCIKR